MLCITVENTEDQAEICVLPKLFLIQESWTLSIDMFVLTNQTV